MHTLDGKGRITVPARYRDVLLASENGQMVVTKSLVSCLTLFPRSVWDRFEAALNAKPASFDPLRRLFIGSASEVSIDGASRLLLAPELREFAGIDRDVVFMGLGNRFELWDKARAAANESGDLKQDWGAQLQDLMIG